MTPKISIITVVWNDKLGLERTILSVINQTYSNLEVIIIDGGSTDGTVDVIEKYKDHISYWVSEPDRGIYDAMNKGINAATGKWVNFMNAGDTFVDNEVLAAIKFFQYRDTILLYGKNINNGVERLPTDPSLMKYGETFANHQSMFFNRDLISKEDFIYDTSYKIYADYVLVNRLYLKYPLQFIYIKHKIANFEGGGVSSTVSTQKRKDKYRALYRHYGIWGFFRGIIYRAFLGSKQ